MDHEHSHDHAYLHEHNIPHLHHEAVARSEKILQGIGHSRRAARHSQGSRAAL